MVTMCGTAWRARSTVTDLPKVILALLCSILKRFIVSDAGGEFLYVRRNVVKHPVNPRSSGSIRIIRMSVAVKDWAILTDQKEPRRHKSMALKVSPFQHS